MISRLPARVPLSGGAFIVVVVVVALIFAAAFVAATLVAAVVKYSPLGGFVVLMGENLSSLSA